MFIFPLIYISSFFIALKNLISRNSQGLFLFLILGLPIYTTSLSVALQIGFGSFIPFMQPLKELIILMALGISLWELDKKIHFQAIDYAILLFFAINLIYVLLPIGNYSFTNKLIAFKSSSFFTIIYFSGRIFDPKKLYLSKYYHYILAVFICAAAILLFEIISDQHFQNLTGYADYNFYYFNQEATGNFGLSWTFETSTGLKRFSSFFANPLEFAAATLLTLAIIAGLYTNDNNEVKIDIFGILAIIATQFSIFFALSRSSLASYFIMIFIYALITKKQIILKIIYALIVLTIAYFIFFMLIWTPDLYEFIVETITFTNPSSIGHVIAWIEGIEAIFMNPLGLGLGNSGRVSGSLGDSVGGENQYIIIGVQTGLITLLTYLWIHIYFIRTCWKWYPRLKGKEKKICLSLLLMKIGFIIPLFTSELESSVYISYLSWFLSGLFIHVISKNSINHKEIDFI